MPTTSPLSAFIAAADAVKEVAERSGLPTEAYNVMAEALTATDFAFEVARLIAQGCPLDAPEVADYFRWTVMKLAELNEKMPEGVRGGLSYECFSPPPPRLPAAPAGAH